VAYVQTLLDARGRRPRAHNISGTASDLTLRCTSDRGKRAPRAALAMRRTRTHVHSPPAARMNTGIRCDGARRQAFGAGLAPGGASRLGCVGSDRKIERRGRDHDRLTRRGSGRAQADLRMPRIASRGTLPFPPLRWGTIAESDRGDLARQRKKVGMDELKRRGTDLSWDRAVRARGWNRTVVFTLGITGVRESATGFVAAAVTAASLAKHGAGACHHHARAVCDVSGYLKRLGLPLRPRGAHRRPPRHDENRCWR